MGFSIHYRSTKPVSPARAEEVERAAIELSQSRSWLMCEPVCLTLDEGGYLRGSSKPNFLPHPDDAASAPSLGLPDGTTQDLLDLLCLLSREHGIDWEIAHDHSDGPIGYIRGGDCDEEVSTQVECFADLGQNLGDLKPDGEADTGRFRELNEDEGEDDGPPILPFRPAAS